MDPSQNLQVLFATALHLVETHLALTFNQLVGTSQFRLQESGYPFDSYPSLAKRLSVIVFVYVTSHGFVLPMR
jgi:hypothetical protein